MYEESAELEQNHISKRRFVAGFDPIGDFQKAAEDALLAPLRFANGIGDSFARGLGGLLPPGSAFPPGAPAYDVQGYGSGASYGSSVDYNLLPSNGGYYR
ncbi:MAG: hypothetical protein AAF585_27825, partial [Verrucomicrobiota bacterium]